MWLITLVSQAEQNQSIIKFQWLTVKEYFKLPTPERDLKHIELVQHPLIKTSNTNNIIILKYKQNNRSNVDWSHIEINLILSYIP